MPEPTTAREELRDRIAAAIRTAAHFCEYGCDCDGAPVWATLATGGTVTRVEADVDALAAGIVPALEAAHDAECERVWNEYPKAIDALREQTQRAEQAEASLEQLRRALDAAERAGVAAVDLNQMLRTELRVTANRLDHIPVPETAADARRQVRLAAEYLRTLAGLSAAAKARQAEMEDPPANEDQDDGVARCRVCGCTEDAACPGGCHWVPDPEGDMCNRCFGAAVRVTVEDLATGEREIRAVPAGDYAIFTTDPCSYVVQPLEGGDHRVTVTGRVERTAPS